MLLIILIGCSSNKIPEGMSKNVYDLGKKATEISQSYVDGNKTAASAFQELSNLYEECELLLTEDSETYDYDVLVCSCIVTMEYNVEMEDSFSVVEDIVDMNDLLTPIEESESISDVIVGSWAFKHDSGWVMKIQFRSNGTGSYSLYNEDGEFKSSDEFKYVIDEDNKMIKGGVDGTLEWYQVDNVTNKSMDYTLIGASAGLDVTGTAYKD